MCWCIGPCTHSWLCLSTVKLFLHASPMHTNKAGNQWLYFIQSTWRYASMWRQHVQKNNICLHVKASKIHKCYSSVKAQTGEDMSQAAWRDRNPHVVTLLHTRHDSTRGVSFTSSHGFPLTESHHFLFFSFAFFNVNCDSKLNSSSIRKFSKHFFFPHSSFVIVSENSPQRVQDLHVTKNTKFKHSHRSHFFLGGEKMLWSLLIKGF